jgi:hypothetical protein
MPQRLQMPWKRWWLTGSARVSERSSMAPGAVDKAVVNSVGRQFA